MDMNQKIKIADSVFAQEVDNEMVLLDMNSENYFGLDEVGKDIWNAMQQTGTLQEVHDAMLEIYDVEEDVLKRDIEVFVDKLLQSGLIELGEE
ncbi:MAG: coenzyme PQQ biosynthesis protein PqqD [Helicobacteraceae bacterium 4484_230]|nr:MAG: coenzyme PQQ biosynthesis protein PqqD [Helicobacteraceae bacterium 4484_230]